MARMTDIGYRDWEVTVVELNDVDVAALRRGEPITQRVWGPESKKVLVLELQGKAVDLAQMIAFCERNDEEARGG